MEGRRVESSAPTELIALVFSRDRQSPEDGRLREALALSVDRGSMNTVLLQGGGEPAGGLLPNWMTGYAFLFPTRSEEHTSELQSRLHLVCRLLLEKKKKIIVTRVLFAVLTL